MLFVLKVVPGVESAVFKPVGPLKHIWYKRNTRQLSALFQHRAQITQVQKQNRPGWVSYISTPQTTLVFPFVGVTIGQPCLPKSMPLSFGIAIALVLLTKAEGKWF